MKAFSTISDAGGVKIAVKGLSILIPNGYGDGYTSVLIAETEEDEKEIEGGLAKKFHYWTMIDCDEAEIMSYDCGNDPAVKISGRYHVYTGDYSNERGAVAFVKGKTY